MKKMNLSIPEPCHEKWAAMTRVEQGKFCGACQKTVIDFTNMSDRQLAEFFKNPSESVCGRLHPDQLNRDISIPRKRIPWIKYFFQIFLPAFLITMRATAQGKVRVVKKEVVEQPIMGKQILRQMKNSHDSSNQKKVNDSGRQEIKTIEPRNLEIPEIKLNQEPGAGNFIPAALHGTAGGIIVSRSKKKRPFKNKKAYHVLAQPEKTSEYEQITVAPSFVIYPNPITQNTIFNIETEKIEPGEYRLEVLTVTGQLMQSEEVEIRKSKYLIRPELRTLTSGIFIVRLTNNKNGKVYTEKLIVR